MLIEIGENFHYQNNVTTSNNNYWEFSLTCLISFLAVLVLVEPVVLLQLALE